MARKYYSGHSRSEVLVSDYIDGTETLRRMIGNTILLYLMADERLDSNAYRRLTTSARAIRDRDKHPKRRHKSEPSEERYLFDEEDFELLIGDCHECQR